MSASTTAGRRVGALSAALALTLALAGCSVDTLIWGPDGAGVIQATEELIDAAAAGDADDLVCPGRELDLGDRERWEGLSAEEPERFVEGHWDEYAALDPAWSINLSLPAERVASGEEFPGDVFYRETDEGLCLVGIAWSTVIG